MSHPDKNQISKWLHLNTMKDEWRQHSLKTGQLAGKIAENISGIDQEFAEICGSLHDIGKAFSGSGLSHALSGYRFLKEQGFSEEADVCLTHSFPDLDVSHSPKKWDGNTDDLSWIEKYLQNHTLTPVEKLIQLCDALIIGSRFVTLETKMIHLSLKYSLPDGVEKRWKALFRLKKEFEELSGINVYDLINEFSELSKE